MTLVVLNMYLDIQIFNTLENRLITLILTLHAGVLVHRHITDIQCMSMFNSSQI